MRSLRPSPALVIACLALLLSAGGVSYATVKATGQPTNIVDPATATNIAKVDNTGALKTNATITAGKVALSPPNAPFRIVGALVNGVGPTSLSGSPTTATLAITDIAFDNYWGNPDPTNVRLIEYSGTGAGACTPPGTANRPLGFYDIPHADTVSEQLTTPLVLKPLQPGQQYCLSARAASPDNGANSIAINVTIGGYVVAGSYTPPTTADTGNPLPPSNQ